MKHDRRNALTLVTLNAGLLRLRLGRLAVDMVPEVERRLRILPEALAAIGADIIALQEVFEPAHRQYLAAALKDVYPHHAGPGRDISGLGRGLMLLSRHPLARVRTPPGMPWLLQAEVGSVTIATLHLVPHAWHGRQIAALIRHANHRHMVLLGDFNLGPSIAPRRWRRLLAAGFIDAGRDCAVTWSRANPLVASGLYRHAPNQRIDHVLVAPPLAALVRIETAHTVLAEEPVSDHYGVLARLAFRPDWATLSPEMWKGSPAGASTPAGAGVRTSDTPPPDAVLSAPSFPSADLPA